MLITGRKQDTIDEAASAHATLAGIAFDPNNLADIPAFVKRMVEQEGVTYVVVNAGKLH